ncbi:polysaccharide biosynthesis/export family protein [Flammeovirga sp. EKP202]|uniref:polysaccharide biosynthesis/export family protein n=1 Tax=Flammeovirga sp. EKP202 TaxID=2770592 RepID=UPI00165FF59C|nr:polysaccharide biosynthesis/export family protein [Flammeovirga sp. EKP202]MBD0403121.1 polysaccharide biosynthesis/export family protein [Flammeovirga sp. EKP202]
MKHFKKVIQLSDFTSLITLLLLISLSSCSIKKSILFKTDTSINEEVFLDAQQSALHNYVINVDDKIAMSVFTNNGEAIVDPNGDYLQPDQISKKNDSGGNLGGGNNGNMLENPNSVFNMNIRQNGDEPKNYLVQSDSLVVLPLIGPVNLVGLTLDEANKVLAKKYSEFYLDPYVVTNYINKKVIVMGATGANIIPLRSEHMTLLDVISQATLSGQNNSNGNGIPVQNDIMATNIRMIRPDPVYGLNKPAVQLIDLSTIQGMAKANLHVMPNDVIYIEPRRKSDTRNLQDVTLMVSVISSVVSLYLLIQQISTGN